MFRNKYSTFLTVLLIVIIIAVVGLMTFLDIRALTRNESTQDAISRFDENSQNTTNDTNTNADNNDTGMGNIEGPDTSSNGNGAPKKTYYQGFVMIGYIEIPKTSVKLPILETETDKSLEVSVAVMYPDNPTNKLNQPGNVVIMGHNYKDGRFFANNNKLSVGDKIYITDITGTKLEYTIYQTFVTTPEDTSFITRNTNGATEVTLSTCGSNSSTQRLIIEAKANT